MKLLSLITAALLTGSAWASEDDRAISAPIRERIAKSTITALVGRRAEADRAVKFLKALPSHMQTLDLILQRLNLSVRETHAGGPQDVRVATVLEALTANALRDGPIGLVEQGDEGAVVSLRRRQFGAASPLGTRTMDRMVMEQTARHLLAATTPAHTFRPALVHFFDAQRIWDLKYDLNYFLGLSTAEDIELHALSLRRATYQKTSEDERTALVTSLRRIPKLGLAGLAVLATLDWLNEDEWVRFFALTGDEFIAQAEAVGASGEDAQQDEHLARGEDPRARLISRVLQFAINADDDKPARLALQRAHQTAAASDSDQAEQVKHQLFLELIQQGHLDWLDFTTWSDDIAAGLRKKIERTSRITTRPDGIIQIGFGVRRPKKCADDLVLNGLRY